MAAWQAWQKAGAWQGRGMRGVGSYQEPSWTSTFPIQSPSMPAKGRHAAMVGGGTEGNFLTLSACTGQEGHRAALSPPDLLYLDRPTWKQ